MEIQPVEKPGNPKVRREKIIKAASARGEGKIRGGRKRKGYLNEDKRPMYVKKEKGKKCTGAIRVRCLEGESQKAGHARKGLPRLDPQQPGDGDLTPSLENYLQDDGLRHSGHRFGQVYLRATTLPLLGGSLPVSRENSRSRMFALGRRLPGYLSIAGEAHRPENNTPKAEKKRKGTQRNRSDAKLKASMPYQRLYQDLHDNPGRSATSAPHGGCKRSVIPGYLSIAWGPPTSTPTSDGIRCARMESQPGTESHSSGWHRGKIPT